ncbi:hypothetical protein FB446DRAFT_834199 [Lentinula raphanica]|nr:hypothetical protein FB446DRAFT_834199 [Lentinula raphanica]
MQNMELSNEAKDWKHIILLPIKEAEDGSNNYNEFKRKSIFELDAAGYWKYIDGDDYNPPQIPVLQPTQEMCSLDLEGNLSTFRIPGNEAEVQAACDKAKVWLEGDKKALAIIVKAVPVERLYLLEYCFSAHAAWKALKNEYEPTNTLSMLTIMQQSIRKNVPGSEVSRDTPPKPRDIKDFRAQRFWGVSLESLELSVLYVEGQGYFWYKRMPFSLTGALSMFTHVTATRLRDLTSDNTRELFMDNGAAAADEFESMYVKIWQILEWVRERDLSLSVAKLRFFVSKGIFAGAKVSQDGVITDPARLQSLLQLWTGSSQKRP